MLGWPLFLPPLAGDQEVAAVTVMVPFPPLDNIRVILIVWKLRGNIIRTAVCWIVWQSQQHTCMSSSYMSIVSKMTYYVSSGTLNPTHSLTHSYKSNSSLELYYCNMMEWFWLDSSCSQRPTGFPQCFDTVGLVIWPVKLVPERTYNVLSGTLSLYTTLNCNRNVSWHVFTSAVIVPWWCPVAVYTPDFSLVIVFFNEVHSIFLNYLWWLSYKLLFGDLL